MAVTLGLSLRRPAEREQAELRLVAEHALRVAQRVALGVLGDREAAEDVAQDVAIVALRRVHTVRDPEMVGAWLYRVATRAALKQARRDRSRREAERASIASHDLRPSMNDQVAEALDLLEGLPARQRAAITLRYVHDLPDGEIARALGCRPATVRTLLSRGRGAVRDRLGARTSLKESICE